MSDLPINKFAIFRSVITILWEGYRPHKPVNPRNTKEITKKFPHAGLNHENTKHDQNRHTRKRQNGRWGPLLRFSVFFARSFQAQHCGWGILYYLSIIFLFLGLTGFCCLRQLRRIIKIDLQINLKSDIIRVNLKIQDKVLLLLICLAEVNLSAVA